MQPAPILAQIFLKKEIANIVKHPVRVQLPNSLTTAQQEYSICLFCRSEDKASLQRYLSSSKSTEAMANLDAILTLNDVKRHLKEFKDKYWLQSAHSHFMCDARIMDSLYHFIMSAKLFGSSINHFPVPIEYERIEKLPRAIAKSLASTYIHLKGKNIVARLGHTRMPQADVCANISAGLERAVLKIEGGWKRVHSIHIKTAESSALPIYSRAPSEALDFAMKLAHKGVAAAATTAATSAATTTSTNAVTATTAAGKNSSSSIKSNRKRELVKL
jgi:ribosome biogenesis protein UTP30